MTEKQLYRAFDFQRFSGNPRLQAVIDAAHARVAARELSDEELEDLAAAGAPEQQDKPEKPEDPLC